MAYSFDSHIRFSECDTKGRLSMLGLVNYFQDCSVSHTESIGHGMRYLQDKGLAWFLSAWNIEIFELPVLGDAVRVSTWCYGMKHLIAQRAFELSRTSGEVLARADSQWFMFDFDAQAPIRVPKEEEEPFLADLGKAPEMQVRGRRIKCSGEGVPGDAQEVSAGLLDTNGHMNNAFYIEMARLAASLDELSQVRVQYKRAATAGDIVIPYLHEEPDGLVVRLASQDAGDDFALVSLA